MEYISIVLSHQACGALSWQPLVTDVDLVRGVDLYTSLQGKQFGESLARAGAIFLTPKSVGEVSRLKTQIGIICYHLEAELLSRKSQIFAL